MPKEGRNLGHLTTRGQPASVAGDFVLGAGWGDSTKSVATGSCDHFGAIEITAVTGGGLAQATATIAYTFDTAFAAAPAGAVVSMWNDNDVTTQLGCKYVVTATTLTITCPTIPVDTKKYTFTWFIPSRS